MVVPVPPADHVIVPPTHPDAVKIALSVPQITVLFEVILGDEGAVPVEIITELELTEVPQVVVQVAV